MTDLLGELAGGVLATLAYAAAGTVVLALGYAVLDAITPGNLRALVYADHNRNAAVLAGANVLAVAGIVTTAIVTADDERLTVELDESFAITGTETHDGPGPGRGHGPRADDDSADDGSTDDGTTDEAEPTD